ncbi:hypothetical protein ACIQXI_21580 [Lysinibacillus sp. NPDC097195]|uniref:hypothetical protein n=1 Tax=Lysinibacillus sp. NPDC097195 TaxID=3364141 RepID=UPI003813AD02
MLIDNEEVVGLLSIAEAINFLEEFFASDEFITPSRKYIDLKNEKIVFTCGNVKNGAISGFRAYWQYDNKRKFTDHITVIVDNKKNNIKGIITGNNLGLIRTGAIGGVAIDHLSNKDSKILGVLGTGLQAKTQVLSALCTRDFKKVIVYSRNPKSVLDFINDISKATPKSTEFIGANYCKEVVTIADVLICATNSKRPLFPKEWLKPGVHINAIGPKGITEHEIGLDVLNYCDFIVTDSLIQVHDYPTKTLLSLCHLYNSVIDLKNVVKENLKKNKRKENDISLFYSVGISGSEVYLGNKILDKLY